MVYPAASVMRRGAVETLPCGISTSTGTRVTAIRSRMIAWMASPRLSTARAPAFGQSILDLGWGKSALTAARSRAAQLYELLPEVGFCFLRTGVLLTIITARWTRCMS